MTTDFIVSIKVRNGRLLRAIRAKYGTTAEMARQTGISVSALSGLLTMRISPLLKSGEWATVAFDVSSALLTEPEELWPAHVAKIKIARNEREIDMSMEDVQDMIAGPEFVNANLLLEKWTKGLSDRGVMALVLHSNGATLDDMGKEFGGITRERARQILIKAMRHVRKNAARQHVDSVEDLR
jgi:transcriptional regulator with XRE-family HTH domain